MQPPDPLHSFYEKQVGRTHQQSPGDFFLADIPRLTPEQTPLCHDDGVEMFWMPVTEIDQTPIQPRIQKPLLKRTMAGDMATWWAFVDDTK